ncbi:FCD domain-containing protein [Embleya sp. NBC_00896]|uniref:FadR/GntR family transcriptional regulator n=1 Tax=Embleya sp. NBC_00896 TaxID=2975961 RepID=UPI002F90F064|nr:FCD domain-containing protein [Embleya sp. NBC_00896]
MPLRAPGDRIRFARVARRTISEEVRDALLASVREGELRPGARLPPERTLCEQFGVARTSVREAIQGLVSLGCLVKRGNRFYVAERLPGVSFDAEDGRKLRVSELFEVRQVTEVAIARLAAIRAEDDERAEITELAAGFDPQMTLEAFRRQDRRFHAALARACGNTTLRELYAKVLDAVFASGDFASLLDAEGNADAVRQVITESCRSHRDIADAVAAGAPDAAARAAAVHLGEVEKQMTARMF